MAKETVIPTVQVAKSRAVFHPEGATALVIETTEGQSIAFLVTKQSIQIIREQLAECEAFLSQPKGNA